MKSSASTVEQYLAELPDDRREAIETVRQVILENLPLELIGESITVMGVSEFVERVKAAHPPRESKST